jgi:proline dehydrogenase
MSLLDRALARSLPAVPKPILRRLSRRYIAGARWEDAARVVRSLAAEGAMATLDILGELNHNLEEAERSVQAYVDVLRRIHEEKLPATNVSVKLTALGLLLDREFCLDGMRRILAVATELDNFVRIDMEDSRCTDGTLDLFQVLRREFPGRVGPVLQARLRRTLDDAEKLAREPLNVRLCKGIYLEPRRIAYGDPEIVRANFVLVLEHLLERGAYVGIATHDERLVFEALRLVRRFGLSREQYEFQMLLGVDEPLRRMLIESGHRLRVYVPFGEQWHAYSLRRLRENPQIAGYVLRALLRRA